MSLSSSLYRIVEDSESRLVLRGSRFALWLLALFLLANATILLFVGLAVTSRRQIFPLIAATVLGLFFAVCGGAALVWAIRYRSRIEVLREQRVVRWQRGTSTAVTEIPFSEVGSIEIEERQRRGSRGRTAIEYRVFLVDKDDGEWLIDRSGDGARMLALTDRLRGLIGVRERASSAGREEDGEKPPTVQRRQSGQAAADPPEGITVQGDGLATVYGWRTLPRSPFWALFWGLLTLMLGGFTVLLVAAFVLEISRQSASVTVSFAGLAILTLVALHLATRRIRWRLPVSVALLVGLMFVANILLERSAFIKFAAVAVVLGYVASLCGFVLLARCRLRVSATGLAYEERILGLPLGWRRRSLAAADVDGLRIKAAVRGGGAIEVRSSAMPPFNLMIPQGPGAFSRSDLKWLRERCLEALRRHS